MMLKDEIDCMDAIGKTINGILFLDDSPKMVISFEDNTFIAFDIDMGWEAGDQRIVCNDVLSDSNFVNPC